MAMDIIARGLATSLLGSNGKIASDKMPTVEGTSELTGFFPVGKLTDPSLVEGKTAEEILLMMLFGVVSPTLTAPSLSIELSTKTPLLIGREATLEGALVFDRGRIDPAYGTSGYRAGLPISFSITDKLIETSNTTYNFKFSFTPTASENFVGYSVSYSEGEQPLNSIGQNFNSPLPAGIIGNQLSIAATYPIYCDEGKEIEFEWIQDEDGDAYQSAFATEATGERQAFAVSNNLKVIGVKTFDDLAQQWNWLGGETAEVSLTYFDTTTVTGESLGEKTDYTLYTHNYLEVGARELRIYVE